MTEKEILRLETKDVIIRRSWEKRIKSRTLTSEFVNAHYGLFKAKKGKHE